MNTKLGSNYWIWIAIGLALLFLLYDIPPMHAEDTNGLVSLIMTTDVNVSNDTVITDTTTVSPFKQNEGSDQFKLPNLQFNNSVGKVNVIEGFALSEKSNFYKIPLGSIIDHSTNGITKVFNSDGKQILIANDIDSAKISTPQGNIPATKILQVPSGSFIKNIGRITLVYSDNSQIFTVVNPTVQTASPLTNSPEDTYWIELAKSENTNNLGSFIAHWTVPSLPTSTDSRSWIALFNGIQPRDSIGIVQPVLQTTLSKHYWNGTAEYVDQYGNGYFTPNMPIAVGDTVEGTLGWVPSHQYWVIRIWDETNNYMEANMSVQAPNIGNTNIDSYVALEGKYTDDNLHLPGTTVFHDIRFKDTNNNPINYNWVGEVDNNPSKSLTGLHVSSSSSSDVTLYTNKTYMISPTAGAGGTTSPASPVSVLSGSDYIVTITPNDPPYKIRNVLVDGISIGTSTSYTFTNIQTNHTLDVTFIRFYILIPNVGLGGTMTPSTAVNVPQGGSQTFTITPNAGYQIENVVVSGVSKGAISNYTFTNVQADSSITATFKPLIVSPIANFTATPRSGTKPLPVQFTDTSTGNPNSWNWNFGDGDATNATERNSMHIYNSAGSFTVSLNATNSTTGSNTTVKPIYITVTPLLPPIANFTATSQSGIRPLTVQFTDTSSGIPNSWSWDFGDGNVTNASVRNPVHTYWTNNSFTVSLTATNASTGSNTTVKLNFITVTPPLSPVANFTATPCSGTEPLTIQFTDTSLNSPTSWNWNFGDGSTSTDQNPMHTYLSNGTYSVTLTAANSAGPNTSTKSNYITVIPPVPQGPGNDATTVILMHYDTTDPTLDSALGANLTFTTSFHPAVMNTTNPKFGSGSLFTNDFYNNYLRTSGGAPALYFGTDNFTIDFWIKPLMNQRTDYPIFGWHKYNTGGLKLDFYFPINTPRVIWDDAGITRTMTSSTAIPFNMWTHVAIVGEPGGVVKLYQNGNMTAISTAGHNIRNVTSAYNNFDIGDKDGSGYPKKYTQVNLDEFRLMKGTAYWTGNFTPPTSAYCSGS